MLSFPILSSHESYNWKVNIILKAVVMSNIDEKQIQVEEFKDGIIHAGDQTKSAGDVDVALRFLKGEASEGEASLADEKKLLRKIDWMIVPIMWLIYNLQYLDKTLSRHLVPPQPDELRLLTAWPPSQLRRRDGTLQRCRHQREPVLESRMGLLSFVSAL